ncbi:MAG: bifunctional methionine sulfoxide reductase B/A protein [Ferruginibacter sp.]|nr:bifunctional methionine sulfoxide reductase B/A protein [Ferruginibacter sp.]
MKQLLVSFFSFSIVFVLHACAQKNHQSTRVETGFSVSRTDDEWKKILSKEQFDVLRLKGTERPYTGKLLNNKEKGIYTCAGCGNELFTDEMKFDSHCGWPSFDSEISGGKIITAKDYSLGMHRIEIMCAKCGGHLGHLFDDGPTITGKRYCVNSVSLSFQKFSDVQKKSASTDTITLGGGCFWCVEAVYEKLDGVISVESGYSGGKSANPTYQEVSYENTGHAEVVQIVFDTQKTSIEEIFKVFFTVHDPTTLNMQGNDVGEQYRSVIFYRNTQQYSIAKGLIDQLNKQKVYDRPVVTELSPFSVFYKAENYHQDYYALNKTQPYCRMVIQPKMEKFEKLFKDRLKKNN